MKQRFASLQAARGVAAVLVVLFHATITPALPKYFGSAPLGGVFGFGHAGVEFFFVLSGFIIVAAHRQDIGRPERLNAFLWKRWVRVFPVYWVLYAVVGAAMLAMPSASVGAPTGFWSAVAGALLIPQDKLLIGTTTAPVLAVAWSLQYEVLFYLLFASCILHRTLGCWLAGSVLVGAIVFWHAPDFPANFIGTSYPFLFAMGAGVAFIDGRRKLARPILVAGAGVLLFLATAAVELAQLVQDAEKVLSFSYGAGSTFVVLGLMDAERVGKLALLHTRLLQLLGDASYSIYLTHFPLVSLGCKLLSRWPAIGPDAAFVLLVVSSLVAGVLFHLAVEKPGLAFLRQRTPQVARRRALTS